MDLGEAEILRAEYDGYRKWEDYLTAYFSERGMGREWVKYGLWRWHHPPKSVIARLKEEGIEVSQEGERGKGKLAARREADDETLLTFEGDFSMERVAPFLNIISPVSIEGDGVVLENTDAKLSLHPDGRVTAGNKEGAHARDLHRLEEVVYRASECVGCGICPGRCPTGALGMENGRIVIDVESCAHCSLCLDGPCPVVDFGHRR